METSAFITTLRCVAVLNILMLSLAATSFSQESLIIPDRSKIICAPECRVSCAPVVFTPLKYKKCYNLCMTACENEPNSDVAHGCTRNCVNSMKKSMTTTVKPRIYGTQTLILKTLIFLISILIVIWNCCIFLYVYRSYTLLGRLHCFLLPQLLQA